MARWILIAFLLILAIPGWAQANSGASAETRKLFENFLVHKGDGFLFGHQNATVEGVGWNWKQNPKLPDVYQVSGKYPALVGFDFFDTIDRQMMPASELIAQAQRVANWGGVVTISWHMYNPVSGKDFRDKTPAVKRILPGGDKHEFYKSRLDEAAEILKQMKHPVILRLFHEHNAPWFWWGISFEREFVQLWRFTVDYLRKIKGVQNILIAYSPDKLHFWNCGYPVPKDQSMDTKLCSLERRYLYKYPGDTYVDILGLDYYSKTLDEALPTLATIGGLALQKQKPFALTETGEVKLPNSRYWTQSFLKPLLKQSIVRGISYVMVWRNGSLDHFYAPYPGQTSVPDFLEMAKNPNVLFADEFIRR